MAIIKKIKAAQPADILKAEPAAPAAAPKAEIAPKAEAAPKAEIAPKAEAAPAAKKQEKAAKAEKKEKAPKAAKAAKAPKAPKAPRAIPASKVAVTFEHQGRQMTQAQVLAHIAQAHQGSVKSLELYFKAEDGAVYYVLNGDTTGRVDI